MRIGVTLRDAAGPDALARVRDELQRAADEGFPSAWMNNIFGLDALTALAVAGSQVPGIELGTAVVPTYPRHPAALAQQALTVAAATGGRLTLGRRALRTRSSSRTCSATLRQAGPAHPGVPVHPPPAAARASRPRSPGSSSARTSR